MQRRDFGRMVLAAAAGAGLSVSPVAAEGTAQPEPRKRHSRKNTKMHVSSDYHVVEGKEFISKENLDYNLRFGITHINPDPVLLAAGSGPPTVKCKKRLGRLYFA